MCPIDALRLLKLYARAIELGDTICNHAFRATGITAYLLRGGTIELAAAIATHKSTRTTQLCNRTSDRISLEEIENIPII